MADGCGGLGSKRYARQNDATGAKLAAEVVKDGVSRRAASLLAQLPQTAEEGRKACRELAQELAEALAQFERENGSESKVRITGRMQRVLPTTLCLTLMKKYPSHMEGMALWAGDSRAYVLNMAGLHQLTADHVQGKPDPLENLYRDAPLSNMICAGEEFYISARKMRCAVPCVMVAATDGAFAYLPTPMEFEWLLLSTLCAAKNMESWKRKLSNEIKKTTSDDSTLLLAVYGYDSFEHLQQSMEERRLFLQKNYITPIRRHKQNSAYAREKWQEYRMYYDWTEGSGDGETDWRI